jgi:hypothetical protein
VFVAEQFLAQQQNLLAQAQGDVALGLIRVYRALGGGWEYRLSEEAAQTDAAVGADAPDCRKPAAVSPIALQAQNAVPAKEGQGGDFASARPEQELGAALHRRDVAAKRIRTPSPDH